ncbi:MAG: 2-C-methyl-D-erythritol 4-phosphate cytidylyltransferase [Gammaproteobacteria bacterium]|nr:MAG: 2-C-methyl-D-erythritol 4-phosphate cytidylyltransferase [Gammaproteobacteria bacterium]
MNAPRYWAVVPAAGVGRRMGAELPKQYLQIGGRCIIEHTLDCLASHPRIAGVVVAVARDDGYWPEVAAGLSCSPIIAEGGAERCQSVLNALTVLSEHANQDDWVLVHDAVRPCLSHGDIDRLMTTLTGDPEGGLLGMPVRDTMKRANGSQRVAETVSRDGLWHAATPQMFPLGRLRQVLTDAIARGLMVTDEAQAVELAGGAPRMVEGSAGNIKITRPQDLELAAFYIERRDGES